MKTCTLNQTIFYKGESVICSNDKKTTDLKEICINLRRNAVKGLCKFNQEEGKNHFDVLVEFPDEAYELLKRLLELDSEKRISAEDASKHSFFQN